jgi:hypothetical protein
MANQTRPPGLFVHQVLGRGRRAKPPQSTGMAPWAKVETPGAPPRALNTFVSYGGSYAFSRGGGGVLACTQPNGEVTFEEPTAKERKLAMGFPRGFSAAAGLSESTRRELLGQAMDLNSLTWVLAACRASALRKTPRSAAEGEAECPSGQARLSSAALHTVGTSAGGAGRRPEVEGASSGATDRGAGGARGGGRVSLLPQPVGKCAEAEGASSGATGQGAGGARGGGRVSLPPHSVGRRAEAEGAEPGATGHRAGGARGGGRVSLPPQPVQRCAETEIAGPGAKGQRAGGARGGGRVSLPPESVARFAEAEGSGPSAIEQGARGARGGGRVSLPPQSVGRRAGAKTGTKAGGALLAGTREGRALADGTRRGAPGTTLEGCAGDGTGGLPGVTGDEWLQQQGPVAGPGAVAETRGEMDGQAGPKGAQEGGWFVGEQLAANERQHVAAVVEKNRDVFAFGLEEIGQFKLFEVRLKLKSEQPIFERRRKHSPREWELVDERCRELEAVGIIDECDSDFASNSVMAAKKDPEGNWKLARFCTDLRDVNEQTAQDRYPMPLPEEQLEGLGHARFYSTIDIRGALHQLVVKESVRRKLAFWSSSKLYCWERCPFGARNASAWFQRAIDRTLRGFEAFARSFIDDLLVAGGETAEEHMELVQRVFDRLREVGLKCHLEK